MVKFKIYTDRAFLDAFVKLKPSEDSDYLEVWRHLVKVIEVAEVDLDLQIDDFIDYVNNSILWNLLINYTQNIGSKNSKDLENAKTVKSLLKQNNKPIFILRDNLINISLKEENTGLCFISSKNCLEKWSYFVRAKDFAIRKQATQNSIEFRCWSDLFAQYRYPTYSYILADNYILQSETKMKHNLYKLLRELLHNSNNITIQTDIIIISGKFDYDIEYIYSQIEKAILAMDYRNVSLTIIKAEHHDRILFSNYFTMTSGNSFNYFDKNQKVILDHPTTLSIQPIACSISNIRTYISNIKEIIQSAKESDFRGSKTSRLLEVFSNLT